MGPELRWLTGSRLCLYRWTQHSSQNSNKDISLTASKGGIILINYLHLKIRSVKCLCISRSIKKISKVSIGVVLKNMCSTNFLQNIIKSSVTEFIFSKILYFRHILLKTFRRNCLKYENYSLRRMLLRAFKQQPDYKSLTAKTFERNTSEISKSYLGNKEHKINVSRRLSFVQALRSCKPSSFYEPNQPFTCPKNFACRIKFFQPWLTK